MVYVNHCHYSVVDWKQALVTPIFKIGSRYDPKIYCPVSLTLQVCKILESFVLSSNKQSFLYNIELISQHQHKGRSCLTNLLTALND